MVSKFDYNYLSHIYDACKSSFWDDYSNRLKPVLFEIPSSILDLGCGTGLAIDYLNCCPKTYLGVDISDSMLDIAKKKYPLHEFRNDSILTFYEPREFDLVLSAFDTLNHFLKPEDWGKAFHTAKRHLSSDGIFAFDVVTPYDHEFNWPGQVNLTESEKWLYLQRSDFNREKGLASMTNTIFHNTDFGWSRYDEEIYQISLPVSSIQELLRNAGLKCFKIVDLQNDSPPTDTSSTLLFFCRAIT